MQKVQVRGGGQRPAILFIDLYRGVFGDERLPLLDAIPSWPSSCGVAAWEAIPHIERLLATARLLGIKIFHMTADPDAPRFEGGSTRAGQPPGMDPEQWRHRYDIIDNFRPIDGEVVVRTSSPSAFHGTALADYLVGFRVDTLVVAGETTSGCVRATVVDGRSHAFRVMIPEECVFDRDEVPHAISLFDMNEKYADVISLDQVLDYLQSIAPAYKV